MSYAQKVFNRLRRGGLTEAAALGMLGNWQEESGIEPYRLQGDFSTYRTASKLYTSRVDSGVVSRYAFGTDQQGYGLAQWTYVNYPKNTAGRKFDLYDFWRQTGGHIDDVIMQTDFALWELHHGYSHVLGKLAGCTDIYTATNIICREFEQPAINNVDARFQSAMRLKNEINLTEWQETPPDEPEQPSDDFPVDGGTITPAEDYWPPRGRRGGKEDPGLCEGMSGYDVSIIQAILKARGYPVTKVDGVFGSYLGEIVRRFQSDQGLAADGIVGPNTWTALWRG